MARTNMVWAAAGMLLMAVTSSSSSSSSPSSTSVSSSSSDSSTSPVQVAFKSRRVHAFFYLWYGTPEADGQWQHWNHEVLPHWDPTRRNGFPSKFRFKPPEDVHSPFYPLRGCYSSRNKDVIMQQMQELKENGVGVVVLSWSGRPDLPGTHDTQGIRTDDLIELVLDVAEVADMRVALHLEPYENRTAFSVREDLLYLADRFSFHPAIFRMPNTNLPMYYVYDSYRVPVSEWIQILRPNRPQTIRGTKADGCIIGLWLDSHHGHELVDGGFDGAYTYFASDGFTFGSSVANWRSMSRFSLERDFLFIPSVGPGYDDSKIRPWNRENQKPRTDGAYYDKMWQSAVAAQTEFVSITSYNEWGEGTQIEPAVPKTVDLEHALDEIFRAQLGLERSYESYEPHDPFFYLNRTAYWSAFFVEQDYAPFRHVKHDKPTHPHLEEL